MVSEQIGFVLQEKIAALQDTILTRHPRLPTLLKEIRATLEQYPENILILKEADIQIIVSGLEVQMNTFLVETSTKAAKSASKASAIKAKGADAF